MIRRIQYQILLFRAKPIERTLKLFLAILLLYLLFCIANFIIRRPSYYITINAHDDMTVELGVRDYTPKNFTKTVVLLHSEKYDSRLWEDIGTMDVLVKHGYRAFAVDLPGHGYSYLSTAPSMYYENAAILEHVLQKLRAVRPILVVPESAGIYGLPLLVRGEQLKQLQGFVGITPSFTERFSQVEYNYVKVPTLVIYGESDTKFRTNSLVSLLEIPKAKINVILNAKKDCYVSNKDDFHFYLLRFIQNLN